MQLAGAQAKMHRLHALIAVASCIIALRGFQVLRTFGIIPSSKYARFDFDQCTALPPAPPFIVGTSLQTAAAAGPDVVDIFTSWLTNNGADYDNVRVASFSGLRGLQAAVQLRQNDLVLSVPTNSCISIGTFSAAAQAAKHPLLSRLLALPDGDTYLEVLALFHEALVYGYEFNQLRRTARSTRLPDTGSYDRTADAARNRTVTSSSSSSNAVRQASGPQVAMFGPYLATLPSSISLPVFLNNPSSSSSSGAGLDGPRTAGSGAISRSSRHRTDDLCSDLLQHLPHLQRLGSKRAAGLEQAWRIVKPFVTALSTSAAKALADLNPCQQYQGFLWAYGMAKTRVVGLETDAVQGVMGQKLQELGLEDVGVMVPLLDMANHATGDQVNARVVGDGTAFRLVATKDIKQGDQIFISYNPSDDENPICSWRWLLEYAFIPGSGGSGSSSELPSPSQDPGRRCFAFNISATAVVDAYMQQQHSNSGVATAALEPSKTTVEPNLSDGVQQQRRQHVLAAVKTAGLLDSSFWTEVDGLGLLPDGLVDWTSKVISVILAAVDQEQTSEQREVGSASSSSGSSGLEGDSGRSVESQNQCMSISRQYVCGCDCGLSAGSITVKDGDSGQDGMQPDQALVQCATKCVLQRMLQQQRKALTDAISYAHMKLQQQAQSCSSTATEPAVSAAGGQLQHSMLQDGASEQPSPAVGSCGVEQEHVSDAHSALCHISDVRSMLQVAVDGDAALQATLEGLL